MKHLFLTLALLSIVTAVIAAPPLDNQDATGAPGTVPVDSHQALVNIQLDKVNVSISNLIASKWTTYTSRTISGLSKEEITSAKAASDVDVTVRRLEAIDNSIRNITAVLSNTLPDIGQNCGFVQVCTLVVCTKYGLPADSQLGTSGGTPVCLEAECRAYEEKFVCK